MADLAHVESTAGGEHYRRARDIAVWWDDARPHALAASTGRVLRLTAPLLAVLFHAENETGVADLASAAQVPHALVRQLIDVGLLEPADVPSSTPWSALELAVQRRTGMPPAASVDLHAAPAALTPWRGRRIDLTDRRAPRRTPPFSDVLRRRRSIRRFNERPVALGELAELLMEAAGLQAVDPGTASSRRPYPSGGARHSLELFVLTLRIVGLDPGCWWFDPLGAGALVAVDTDARFRDQIVALLAQDAVAPAGIILITSRFERSLYKYGSLGLSLIYKDTGCLLQTLYLQATAADLAGYAIGGGPEAAIATGLGLDPLHQSYVGAFVFGPSPATSKPA